MTLFGVLRRIAEWWARRKLPVVRWYQTRMAMRCAESCGTGLKVNRPSRFLSRCRFGNNCNFNGMTVLGRGRVTFGDNFHSGENCRIITSNHNYDGGEAIPYDGTNIEKEIVIGDNVWFGAECDDRRRGDRRCRGRCERRCPGVRRRGWQPGKGDQISRSGSLPTTQGRGEVLVIEGCLKMPKILMTCAGEKDIILT